MAIIVFALWAGPDTGTTDINTANPYPAIFLGGFGMMATYWLTRSMRASEPVVDVTPTTLLARTAALCAVALVPFACGCLALLRFVQLIPVSSPLHGPFSPSARVAVLIGQIVIPALGGPLLGVALGRWVRFPGAALVLFLVLYGWVTLVTILSMSHQNSAFVAVLRLFAPFAFFTYTGNAGGVTAWRGSPWFFIGWQLALCAITVLAALLRGAEGPVRSRIIRALGIAGAAAVILLMLAATAGSPTPSPRDDRAGAAGRGLAGGRRRHRRGGRGGRLRGRVPGRRHHAAPDLLRAARRRRGVHPGRAGQPGRRRDTDRAPPGAPGSAPWRCWPRSRPARWCCWRRPCAD